MILPAVRERLEAVLRHPSMDGALAALRSRRATHLALRLARRCEGAGRRVSHARTAAPGLLHHRFESPRRSSRGNSPFLRRAFSPARSAESPTLPAFDTLPWESQSPAPDILERRAATLFRLADGQVSLVIAPVAAALWRYQDPLHSICRSRARSPKTSKVPHRRIPRSISAPSATRARKWSSSPANSRCAVASSTSSPPKRRAPSESSFSATPSNPSANSTRARSARSRPSVRTTLLPLTEWYVPPPEQADGTEERRLGTIHPSSARAPKRPELALRTRGKLTHARSSSSTNRKTCAKPPTKHLAHATENYERHGQANAPSADHYFLDRSRIRRRAGKNLANQSRATRRSTSAPLRNSISHRAPARAFTATSSPAWPK